MDMTILNQQSKMPFGADEISLLERVAVHAAGILKIAAEAELSVVLMDNDGIRDLNRDYRGIDAPTDVLSFAMLEEGDEEPDFADPSECLLLGDIIISLEKAEEQRQTYGHSLQRELAFLFTHGLLHLLGYDHLEDSGERQMLAMQDRILKDLGLTRDS